MRDPTSLDVTQVLYQKLIVPITELFNKLICTFFDSGQANTFIVALGTVDSAYTSGKPKVLFDRDTEMSGKTYAYLNSYTPTANDRVLLIRQGGSWVILGKVIS